MPKHARKDKQFRKRYAWFFLTQLTGLVIAILYQIWTTAFIKVPQEYQWVLGLMTPIIGKEIFVWTLNTLSSKATGLQDNKKHVINLSCLHYIESKHAIFVSIMMGSILTPFTTWIILGMDFIMNIYNGLKIVYTLKYSKKENAEEDGKLQQFISYFMIYTKIIFTCNDSEHLKIDSY